MLIVKNSNVEPLHRVKFYVSLDSLAKIDHLAVTEIELCSHHYRPQTVFTGVCLSTGSVSVSVPGGSSSRGVSIQGGLCPGGSLSRGSVSGKEGLCPGGLCQRGLCPRGLFPEGLCLRGGGLCPGGLCPGESLSLGDPWPPGQRPPYGNEREVRILLECILVKKEF